MNASKKLKGPAVKYSTRRSASEADYSTEVNASQIAKLEEAFRAEFETQEWEEETARAW